MSGLLKNLGQIRQVINVYSAKRASKLGAEQVVLTKRDETQEKRNTRAPISKKRGLGHRTPQL
jgi:hypothetical protein